MWYLTLVVLISTWFVTTWPGFCMGSFLFVSVLRKLGPLMSQQLNLGSLGLPDTCFICLMVAFELSSFLANGHTLLAGNLSKSMLPSLMVLDMKSPSFKKNQKMSLWSILAVSGGYLAKFTCTCIALYHLSMVQFPCLKLISQSNLAQTSLSEACNNLHISPI